MTMKRESIYLCNKSISIMGKKYLFFVISIYVSGQISMTRYFTYLLTYL